MRRRTMKESTTGRFALRTFTHGRYLYYELSLCWLIDNTSNFQQKGLISDLPV